MRDDRKSTIAAVIIVMVLLSGSLFVFSVGQDQKLPSGMLPAFENYGQMERFVDQASQRGNALNNLPTSWTSQASGDVSHSTTNIQVEGVDEADCVKTDGTYLFIASADAVSIVRAYPPEAMQNVSKIDLKGALGLNSSSYVWIDGIYLHEDRLMVVAGISEPNYYSNGSILSPMIWRVPEDETLVCLFSLSDMQQPLLLGTFGISGYSITSRMIGGFLYSVTQQSIWTQMGLARPTTFGPNGTTDLPATSIRFDPQSTDPSSFINVMAVDVIGLKCESTSLLAGYASTIYTSQDAMYLTFLKYSAIPMYNSLSAGGETTSMAQASVEEYNTTIYKLSIDALSVKPAAQGDVPGYMLNQFSMDEKDGRLRVATSSGWMDQQSSSVFILDQHLNVTGELRNIAPGERIYSVRFVDDSLYLVTFRQVDPLFVINLGNPTSPIILGQLNVSGFSSYLQPLDQDHLVGIGMQNGSLKLSLFNVTQSSSPREVGTVVVPGWSNSQAMWDHKAVLFDAQTGTLAIPITSYDQGGNYSSSIMVFDVNSTHIAVRGKVLAGQMEYLMRAQFIGNFLYSISDTTIRVNLISDLSQVNEFVYQERAPSYFPFLLSGGEVVAVGAMR